MISQSVTFQKHVAPENTTPVRRLDEAAARLKDLGVSDLRTGLSWADSFRPNALDWFDRQMDALQDFNLTITFCFTPEHLGEIPHHTSAPRALETFATFCAEMVARYAPKKPFQSATHAAVASAASVQ